MRIVLDTNVIVAAFATRGLCASVLELCLDRCEIVLSEAILEETNRNLRGKIGVPAALCDEIISYLRQYCSICRVKVVEAPECKDEEDLHVLGLAEAAQADYIVTGDKDLSDLEQFRGIRIVTPRQFWEIMKAR